MVTSFTVPGFTALELGTAAKLKYAPQWVISNVGSDIVTLKGFLKDATEPLLEGAVSDAYLPLTPTPATAGSSCSTQVNQKYNDNAPFDGNVEYGMALAYTTVAGDQGGRQEPHPRLAHRSGAEGRLHRPGPGAVPVLQDRPLRVRRHPDRHRPQRRARHDRSRLHDRRQGTAR